MVKGERCIECGAVHGIEPHHPACREFRMWTAPTIEGELRTFDTGATRSPLGDKLQYEGYLSPLVLFRFAQYMKKHQTQSDGKQREADNWQNGIPKESLMDSGMRHYMDWWLHHRGYSDLASEDIEEALCALLFNASAYLKAVLDAKR